MLVLTLVILTFVILLQPLGLRGGVFHNCLVKQVESILRDAGFEVTLEQPLALPGSGLNFVDVLARRGEVRFACEVETTSRYALVNITNAGRLKVPLLVIVPSRQLRQSVERKVRSAGISVSTSAFRILLVSELSSAISRSFPDFPAANTARENKRHQKNNPDQDATRMKKARRSTRGAGDKAQPDDANSTGKESS